MRFEYQSSLRLLNRLESQGTMIDHTVSKIRDEKSMTFEANRENKAYDLGQIDLMNLSRRPSAVNLMGYTERKEKRDSFYFEKSIELQKEESKFMFNISPNETPKSVVNSATKWIPRKRSMINVFGLIPK